MNKRCIAAALAVALTTVACSPTLSESDMPNGSAAQADPLPPVDTVVAEQYESYQERQFSWHDQREELVQRCMAAAGFTYYPEHVDSVERDANAASAIADVEAFGPQRLLPPQPSSFYAQEREVRVLIGYAMFFGEEATQTAAASVYSLSEGDENSILLQPGDAAQEILSPAQEANRQYTLSLSTEESYSYSVALYGTEEDGAVVGCYANAESDLGGPPERLNFDLDRHLEAEDRVLALVEVHPRMVESSGNYAQCMAAAGYDVANPAEAAPIFSLFVDAVLNELVEAGVDLAPLHRSGAWADVLRADRLSQLQQQEIEFALKDWDCAEDVRITRELVTEEVERDVLRNDYPDVAIDLGIDIEE